MSAKLGENFHSSTVVLNKNSVQISLLRFCYFANREQFSSKKAVLPVKKQ